MTLDSHFAAAHQFLGITYDVQILTGESNDASLFYKADEELRRALQEDPSLLDVHAELAGVAFMQGDKQRALAELNQLVAPGSEGPMGGELICTGWRKKTPRPKSSRYASWSVTPLLPTCPDRPHRDPFDGRRRRGCASQRTDTCRTSTQRHDRRRQPELGVHGYGLS